MLAFRKFCLVASYNVPGDSCNPTPSERIITLPQGCTTKDGKSATIDVGKCNEKRCIARGLKNLNNCKDNFCCQPVAKDTIKIHCLRHSFDLTRVTKCGCGNCKVKRSVVIGVAAGGPDNIPLKYGYIYHGDKYLTRTDRKGHFSFKVPGDLTRLVVTFKDKRGYNNFQDLIKIIPLVPGHKTYVEVRMKIRPEPITVSTKEGFEIPLGVSGSIRRPKYGQTEDDPTSGEHLIPPVSLSLPPQSLMTEEGEIYNGTAKVEVSFVDPRNATQVQEADGDFTTVDDDGEQRQLETYGVISMDFKDTNGNRLQPNTDVDVLVDLDEYNITEKEAEEIKLWYMDKKTGRWRMMENGLRRHETRRSRRSGRQFYFGKIDSKRYHHLINLDELARSCYLKIKVAERDSDFASAMVNVLAIQNNLHRYFTYGVLTNAAKCIKTFCTEDLATIQATIDGDYLIPSESEVNEDVKRQHAVEYYRSKDIGNRFSNRITIGKLTEPLSYEPSPFYSSRQLCESGPLEHNLLFERHEYKQAANETESFNEDWYPDKDFACVCFVKVEVHNIDMCPNKMASFLVESVVGEDQHAAGQVIITMTESKSTACAEYKCPLSNDHRIVVKVVPFSNGYFDKHESAAKQLAAEMDATISNQLVHFKPEFNLKKPKIGMLHIDAIFLNEKNEKKEECLKEQYKAGVSFRCSDPSGSGYIEYGK